MNDEVQKFILAVGAMAEMLGAFRRNLMKQGFDEKQALFLTNTLLQETMRSPSNKTGEES